ncbi:alpha-glucosidase [Coleophoma crateriformis]|uniref:Alpha-glucosidase n=1 Tax=Coleophoma crateriformis TaxID=565419 RepID=A0A3D8T9T8_9HELO|nr:alpha-glucosidase [Coleophoma crateriformis]
MTPQHRAWWKECSVYQIYPCSYKDSNDDGIGDLEGITSKVDYMHKLGVDCVWLSPILKSPQVDMGYDISDYRVIDERYGSLEHVDKLINELKARGMKLLMDLVVNHTSDQHEWFKQSRSSKDNPYRDWYVWRPAKYDKDGNQHPPNNWAAAFQGSVWEWDELTQEYYLHIFAIEQPDLNWENPKVVEAVHAIVRFWLDRGADGFRMDVINFISKDQAFPDAPIVDPDSPWQPGEQFFSAGPRLHEFLGGLGSILKEYNAFSVGEMPCVSDPKEVIKSVGHDRGELNMIFQFQHVDIDHAEGADGRFSPQTPKWPLSTLRNIFETMQKFMYANNGWNALYLENHDQPRSVNRFACGCPKHRAQSSKMLATFLGCQAGTVFVYQGQELGMTNVPVEWGIDEYKDLNTLNHWAVLNQRTKDPEILKEKMAEYQKKSRDNARTPMQWDTGPHAGFTSSSVQPWMNANTNFNAVNAASQVDDPASPFTYWSSMLATRKKYKDIFVYGDFNLVDETNEDIFAYTRKSEKGETMLVLCNFSPNKVQWKSDLSGAKDILLSTNGRTLKDVEGIFELSEYEGIAFLL